jgi:hypothetical protein
MQERAKRGVSPIHFTKPLLLTGIQLLSEEEKAMLAAEEAENSKAGKRGDCVVM